MSAAVESGVDPAGAAVACRLQPRLVAKSRNLDALGVGDLDDRAIHRGNDRTTVDFEANQRSVDQGDLGACQGVHAYFTLRAREGNI